MCLRENIHFGILKKQDSFRLKPAVRSLLYLNFICHWSNHHVEVAITVESASFTVFSTLGKESFRDVVIYISENVCSDIQFERVVNGGL